MRLYIVRHGETDWNKKKIAQGQVDIPLNEYGRFLAEETYKGMKDLPITLAISSPLSRAYETAEIILKGRNIPILKDDRLKEMGFGSGEGTPIFLEDGVPGPVCTNFFDHCELYQPLEGGEDFYDLMKRTKDFLDDLLNNDEYQNENILISSHGCAIGALLGNIRGNNVENFWAKPVPRNCGVAEIEIVDHKPIIVEEDVIYYTLSEDSFRYEDLIKK